MERFIPKTIYIDGELTKLSLSEEIIAAFPKNTRVEVLEGGMVPTEIAIEDDSRQSLYLTSNKGAFVKKCPGTNGFICCNYYVIDLVENCHLDCSYCFLKGYLKDNLIKIYLNTDKLFSELDELLKDKNKFFRIGTGELSDSLALDEITYFSKTLVNYFSDKDNALLELKTKTNNVNNLITLEHNNNVVVSWSLNPPFIVENEENKCSNLDERIDAAKIIQEKGYKLAFHFDPIIYYPNWKEDYKKLIDKLFIDIKPNRIAWISLGGLRFTKDTINPFDEKQSHIFYEELLECPDGKMRYFIQIRDMLYRELKNMIEEKDKDLFVYLCMEGQYMWKRIFDFVPRSDQKLDYLFKERVARLL